MTHQPQEGKYPSEELIQAWSADVLGFKPSIASVAIFAALVGKACDWQREQDALICESYESVTAMNCADSIRHGSQEHG